VNKAPAANEELQQRLNSIKHLGETSLAAARNLSLLLRPSMLDDFGLVPALHWQAREVSRQSGILVEVTAGEVLIEKAAAADSVTAVLDYSEGEFKPKIDFTAAKNRLAVKLTKKNWRGVNKGDEKNWAKATVRLPAGAEIILDYRLKAGETELHLGGLRLKEVDISVWAGQLDVDFETPNLIPMDYLEIDAKVGEAHLNNLGNARYREASVNGGIGQIEADFSGGVEPDSKAWIDLDIGEATVVLPEDAGVRMHIGGMFGFLSSKRISGSFLKRGRFFYSEDYESMKTKCTFHITPGLGELRIEGK
jgi:hypothetical protein